MCKFNFGYNCAYIMKCIIIFFKIISKMELNMLVNIIWAENMEMASFYGLMDQPMKENFKIIMYANIFF